LKIILVVGSWSSGTTAVTGYLSRLGGYTCPPTIMTNDPKTPDSHESVDFRNALAATYNEFSLEKIGSVPDFISWLGAWLPKKIELAQQTGTDFIVLKHPLSAMALGEINKLCKPRVVMVTRPFRDIESTRLRRKWPSNYGSKGAQIIYSRALSQAIDYGIPFVSVGFNSFKESKETRANLIDFCGITVDDTHLLNAENFIRI
jgi:hypothetical protein